MPKPTVAPLHSQRLRLRLIEAGDLPLTLAWRNQDQVRRWFVHSDLLALETHRAWFVSYLERDDDFLFLMEETNRLHKPIGQVGLYRIDRQARTAEYGRLMIGELDARQAGYAEEATNLLLQLAFGGWGLRTIKLEVFADNVRALNLYRRCGFEPTSVESGMVLMQVTLERMARRTQADVDSSHRIEQIRSPLSCPPGHPRERQLLL